MPRRTLRVLVVDDNESVRGSIRQILRSQADIEVVCEAIDGADAVRKIGEHLPDVVLLDITMPSMNGLEVAEIVKRDFPSVQVLIVTQHDSRGFQWGALAAGVSGYVIKSNAGRDLVPELRRIQDLPRETPINPPDTKAS
jgi:DNA-binding NarL/FixJ family response regulator